jgi:hypothetical protein
LVNAIVGSKVGFMLNGAGLNIRDFIAGAGIPNIVFFDGCFCFF